jgi:hypothetical protein
MTADELKGVTMQARKHADQAMKAATSIKAPHPDCPSTHLAAAISASLDIQQAQSEFLGNGLSTMISSGVASAVERVIHSTLPSVERAANGRSKRIEIPVPWSVKPLAINGYALNDVVKIALALGLAWSLLAMHGCVPSPMRTMGRQMTAAVEGAK